MNVLVFLVPAALLLGLGGLAAFLWSVRSRQYDDLEGARYRVLEDDRPPEDEANRRQL
ncbi:MAG: cbb3-type cytochrome oxidase assembly protein CcoS [Pseudomonadota bacterium]